MGVEHKKLIAREKEFKKMLVLATAYLMEEEDWDADRICDFYQKIIEWVTAVNSHLISIDTVISIIKDNLGIEIKM